MRRGLALGTVLLALALVCAAQVSTMFHVSIVAPTGAQGVLDWTQGWITAKGYGSAPENVSNETQGRLLARRGAYVDAQRSILELLEGVELKSETTFLNYAANDVVRTKLEETLPAFVQVVEGSEQWTENDPLCPDGCYTVTMQYNLAGLVLTTLPYIVESTSTGTLPYSSAPAPDYTGVVIDARGLDITPSTYMDVHGMGGSIYAETVAALYVPSVSYELAGTSESVEFAENDPRVGDKPLVVRALGKNEQGTGVVVAHEDGRIIEAMAATTDILISGGGSVLVVAD